MITVGSVGQAKSTRDTDRTWSLPLSHGSRVRVVGGEGGLEINQDPLRPMWRLVHTCQSPSPDPAIWAGLLVLLDPSCPISRLLDGFTVSSCSPTDTLVPCLPLSLFLQFTFPLNGHFPLHVLNNRFNRMFLTNLSDTKYKLTSKL